MRYAPLLQTLLLTCLPLPVAAQSAVLMSTGKNAVKFEMLHPTFDDDDNLSITSGAYFLGAELKLSPNTQLMLELPFAHSSQDVGTATESSSTIGNPYIGIMRTGDRRWFEVGLRLPLASNDEIATLYGVLSDQYRMEAFIPDYASLRVAGSMATSQAPTFGLFTVGSTALIPTDADDDDAEFEVLIDYAGRIVFRPGAAQLAAGVEGRLVATEDGNLAERTDHQAALSVSYDFGRIRPGLQARFPLDRELRSLMNGSFGITLVVPLD